LSKIRGFSNVLIHIHIEKQNASYGHF